MAANHEIKLLEKCRVAPPPDAAVADFTLPLTFYDLQFLVNPPTQFVHFYRFRHDPIPTSPQFIISSLKSSLSMALKHFLPLVGNVIYPIDDSGDDDHHRMPELRYTKGDSVSLTIAESSEDFDYLVGDHQKESYKFHNLVPQLPEPFVTPCSQVSPVFALQVTVFPNFGLSIGRTFFHFLGDATTFINFMKLWASISKFNGDSSLEQLQSSSFQPLCDRSVVQDPFRLGRKILNDIKLLKSYGIPRISNNPTTISKGEVLATFILHRSDVMKLKSFVVGKNVSTFSMTCALMWTCLSKSLDVVREEKVEEDKRENVCAYINFRERFDPPIPQNYFGNCVVPCIVGLTHGQLVGNEGLSVAATAIRGAIHKMAHDREGILKGIWLPYSSHTRTTTALEPGMLVIVGSTQHSVYKHNADYDWGEQVKYENVTVNPSAIRMLITLSRRFEGALELSFSLPKKRMDAFTAVFTNCIDNLHMRSPL